MCNASIVTSEVKLNCSDSFSNSIDSCNFVPSDGSNIKDVQNDSHLTQLLNGTSFRTFMRIGTDQAQEVLEAIKPFANTSVILGVVQWAKSLGGLVDAADITGVYITSKTTYQAHRCVFYLAVRQLEV